MRALSLSLPLSLSLSLSLVTVRELLNVVASLVAVHSASGAAAHGLNSCGQWALERWLSSCGAQG